MIKIKGALTYVLQFIISPLTFSSMNIDFKKIKNKIIYFSCSKASLPLNFIRVIYVYHCQRTLALNGANYASNLDTLKFCFCFNNVCVILSENETEDMTNFTIYFFCHKTMLLNMMTY
jgi:hypothetical protein